MRIKEHITLANFSLQHADHDAFVTCKCKAPRFYLVWRIFWAVYHFSWLIGNLIVTSIQDEVSCWKWFIYLSNWMYMMLTVECLTEAVVVLETWKRKRKSGFNPGGSLPWYVQVMWLLYTLSAVAAVVVCVWYWTFIHKGKTVTAIRFNTHGIAAVYVIVNMAITRLPLRLLHFPYPVAFGVVYTIFSVIYYSLGGTNQNGATYIYSILDWSKPSRTLIITSLSNFVFIPLVFVMLWALNIGFSKLYDRCRQHHVVYSQGLDNADGEEVIIG